MNNKIDKFDLTDFVLQTLEAKDELYKASIEITESMLEDANHEIEKLRKENQALTNRSQLKLIKKSKNKFEIKKGLPLPRSKGKPRKYDLPLENLEVDDNIHIPIPKTKISQEQKIIRNFVLRFTYKNPNKKFTVRQLSDGIGIWRIK